MWRKGKKIRNLSHRVRLEDGNHCEIFTVEAKDLRVMFAK